MKKETWLKIISGLIASMFFYAAFVKLYFYEEAQWEMRNQVFPRKVADVLTWAVPVIELIIVLLLVYRPTRLFAFKVSLALLTVFTLYIVTALSNIFGRIPCGCGGVIGDLPYGWHIIFNLIFIFLAFLGIWLENSWTIKSSVRQIKNLWLNAKKGWLNLWTKKKSENVLQE